MSVRDAMRISWLCRPAVIVALAVPLVLSAGAVAAGVLPAARVLGASSVSAWSAGLALSAVAGLVAALRERELARVLAMLALLAALAQGALFWGTRVDGTLSAGVGEVGAPWARLDAGMFARPPALVVTELPLDAAGPARLRVDGREVVLPLRTATEVDGAGVLTLSGPYPAPSFEVLGPDGARAEAGLVKIDPERRDWFMVGFLPHRLYLGVAGEGAGPDPRAPARLHLRVQRGKLRVLERDVALGERVTFERISFSYGRGDMWARIEVRRRTPAWPGLSIAVALGAAAYLVGRAEGRKRT